MQKAGNRTVSREQILKLPYAKIGNHVLTSDDDGFNECAQTVSLICRRRFKPQDVVILSLFGEECCGGGIAFTEYGVYYWLANDVFDFEVPYDEIGSLNYDQDGVLICKKTAMGNRENGIMSSCMRKVGDSQLLIPGDVDAMYDMEPEERMTLNRNMFGFLSDILEAITGTEGE